MPAQPRSGGRKFLNACLALMLFYVLYQVLYLAVTWMSFFVFAFATNDPSSSPSYATINDIAVVVSIFLGVLITWLVFRKRFS